MKEMMTTANASAPRFILTSHSIDNVFDYCPRKFEFLNLYDRRPPRDSGYAALVGTALHEGIQAFLIARAEGLSTAECDSRGFMAFARHFPWELENEQPTSTRSSANAILLLYNLTRSTEWDNWELVRVDGRGWAVEVPFLIKHTSLGEFTIKDTGERVMLATQGKIDLIMRHKTLGLYKTWDLKTTVTPAQLTRSEYEFSGQQIGYSQVMHAALGIAPQQFAVNYMIARFSATEPPQIVPIEVKKFEDDIDDYWFAKLDRLARIKAYAEQGWFPRTNGGCNSWGSECFFFDICHSRNPKLIRDWFSVIDSEPQQGYDYWIELEI